MSLPTWCDAALAMSTPFEIVLARSPHPRRGNVLSPSPWWRGGQLLLLPAAANNRRRAELCLFLKTHGLRDVSAREATPWSGENALSEPIVTTP